MVLAVCALTYRRPEGLARLLDGLAGLAFSGEPPELRIIIVDNDPDRSARVFCEEQARSFPWPLEYRHEPTPGIAPARNAALKAARQADWIAFIDDDEVPEQAWLDSLIQAQERYQADVVTGPVLPHFSARVPAWVEEGRFFHPVRHGSGQELPVAYTNNVMFRADLPTELGLKFDPRWAFLGCEDLDFFSRVALAGRRIVWCDEARVIEWVPASRTTLGWVLRRAFRCGDSASLVERELYPKSNPYGPPLVRGLKRLLLGTAMLPVLPFLPAHRRVTYLRHIWYGAGMIAGWFGFRYQEYRRPRES